MWSLHAVKSSQVVHLLTGIQYTFGRKDADIIIPNDSSVSRKHGSIAVSITANSFQVNVTDSSKFGLFYIRNASDQCNDDQYIRVDKTATLEEGDLVRIGVQHSLFRLKSQPLLVVTSMMDAASQTRLKSTIAKLGGKVIDKWSSGVTHLVMKDIILNVKVTQALASASNIVTEIFFDKLLEAIREKQPFPEPHNFMPTIIEEGLDKSECSFAPNTSRKTVFKGRTFVFFNKKQLKRIGLTCRLAGASTHAVNELKSHDLNETAVKPNMAFLLFGSLPDPQLIAENKFLELQQHMLENKLRFVQEHEIGLALLYCSGDVYSNPKFDLSSENTFTQRSIPGETLSQAIHQESLEILSENHSLSLQPDTMFVSRVPETVGLEDSVDDTEFPLSKKRYHDTSDNLFDQTPAKSIKLEASPSIKSNKSNDIDLLDDLGLSLSKKRSLIAKPPPKRRIKNQCKSPTSITSTTDFEMNPKIVLNKIDHENTLSRSTDPAGRTNQNDDLDMNDLQYSCVEDDSLWTCKTEPNTTTPSNEHRRPKIHERESAIKETIEVKPTVNRDLTNSNPKVNSSFVASLNKEPTISDIKVQKSRNESVSGQYMCDIKKTFVASSVPEDSLKIENEVDQPLVYQGLCNVVQKSLVKKRSPLKAGNILHGTSISSTTIRNFKKFTKILPTYQGGGSQTNMNSVQAPRIIGGRDLIIHLNRIETSFGSLEWGPAQDFPDVQSQDANPFDKLLDTKVARKKKNKR